VGSLSAVVTAEAAARMRQTAGSMRSAGLVISASYVTSIGWSAGGVSGTWHSNDRRYCTQRSTDRETPALSCETA
jgi:hypothetical protein